MHQLGKQRGILLGSVIILFLTVLLVGSGWALDTVESLKQQLEQMQHNMRFLKKRIDGETVVQKPLRRGAVASTNMSGRCG